MGSGRQSRRLSGRLFGLIETSQWGELVLRTGTVLLVRVAGTGLGFVFNVALARFLGADGLGVYHLALTFALIASVVGRVGMDATLLKFGATSHAANDRGRLESVHRMGMGTAALGCSLVAIGSFVAADWLATAIYHDPAITGPLRLMSLALVPFALLNLYGELLKAGHHQALSSFIQSTALPSVSLLLLLVFARHIVDASAVATIYLAASSLVCLSSWVLWRRSLPRGPMTTTDPVSRSQLLATAMPMYGAATADVVMTFSDVLILGMFATSAEVGIYTAAARTALLTRFLLLATSAVAAPRFAALHAAGDKQGLAKLAVRSTMLTTVASVPLLLLFILFPGNILSLFGPQFEAGAQVLIILGVGQFVNAATGPVGYLLNMSGYHRIEGWIAVLGALVTVGLCFALIPTWGIVGAAAANAIATASCNLLRVWFAKSLLDILMLPVPARFHARPNANRRDEAARNLVGRTAGAEHLSVPVRTEASPASSLPPGDPAVRPGASATVKTKGTAAAKLVFYDDAPNFGGHELMTTRLVEQMARQPRYELVFITSVVNVELCRQVHSFAPSVKVMPQPYASGRGQWLRTYVSIKPLLRLHRLLRQEQPDLLIVVQGGIALSSLGILAGRLARVRTVSYLPMTHDELLYTPTPLRARVRQWLVQPFYSLPDCLVTISPRMAGYAARRRSGPVKVVENGIEIAEIGVGRRDTVRLEFGLGDDDRLLLMIGRIEFAQKRHDLAVEALAIARARGSRLHLLVVGSGPDEPALRLQVQALGLDGAVHWRSWQGEVAGFYAACDVLLLPSRYEGMPLVMLEAMHAGRRVMASDVDGMADMLPPAWTFRSGDAGALADLLCMPLGEADAEHLKRHRELIRTQYTIEAFGRRFLNVIDQELALARA